MKTPTLALLCLSLLCASGNEALAQAPAEPSADADPVRAGIESYLKTYLQSDLKTMSEDDRKYAYDTFDLNNDGKKEVFVALISPYFCGSGGCTMLILNPDFTLHSRMTVVNDFPIHASSKSTKGWKDLIIKSRGTHLLKYNGKKYPANPSTQPKVKPESVPDKQPILDGAYDKKLSF
jgi:Zn-dependent M16 (insulinase) family peptidase